MFGLWAALPLLGTDGRYRRSMSQDRNQRYPLPLYSVLSLFTGCRMMTLRFSGAVRVGSFR